MQHELGGACARSAGSRPPQTLQRPARGAKNGGVFKAQARNCAPPARIPQQAMNNSWLQRQWPGSATAGPTHRRREREAVGDACADRHGGCRRATEADKHGTAVTRRAVVFFAGEANAAENALELQCFCVGWDSV